MKVTVASSAEWKNIADISNGVFFDGHINDKFGPFLKVGSVGAETWVVVRLEHMEGIVWVSGRDQLEKVHNYKPIHVGELVLVPDGAKR